MNLKSLSSLLMLFVFSATLPSIADVKNTRFIPAVNLLLDSSCEDIPAAKNTLYISPDGNDNNDGLSPKTAWKTLSKLQSSQTELIAGTQVLFRSGATFRGNLSLDNVHGAPGEEISFGAYCVGEKPIISGLTELRNWQSAGPNKWVTKCESCPDDLGLFTHNKSPLGFSRYPNVNNESRGYDYTHQFSRTAVVSDALRGKNWRGAELVLRNSNWVLDRLKIGEHFGDTVTFSGGKLTYDPSTNANDSGYGFFIQNHIDAMDLDGEWVWNSSSKEITLQWSLGNPSSFNFAASTQQNVLSINNSSNLSFKDLSFIGGNTFNIFSSAAQDISMDGIDSLAATNSIHFQDRSNNVHLNNLSVTDSSNIGVNLFFCGNCSLTNSNVTDSGMIAGLSTNGIGGHVAIYAAANVDDDNYSVLIEGNTVDRSGYLGISMNDRVIVRNNLVQGYNAIKTDGGGIYMFNIDGKNKTVIENNVVKDPAASTAGMIGQKTAIEGASTQSYGIYLDGATTDIKVHGNTVLRGGDSALFMNKTARIDIQYNKFIDSDFSAIYYRDYSDRSGPTLENPGQIVKHNTIVQLNETPLFNLTSQTASYDLSEFGDINNNDYCAPYSQGIFDFNKPNQSNTDYLIGFADWQRLGFDANGQMCDIALDNFVETSVGNELVSNGQFANNTDNWRLLSNNGLLTHTTDSSGAMLVNDNGNEPNTTINPHIVLLGDGANLGDVYRVSYHAKSNNTENTPLSARLLLHDAPYSRLTSTYTRSVPSQVEQYSFYLSVLETAANFRLWFETNSNDLPLLLDNVSVRRVQGYFKDRDNLILVKTNRGNTAQPTVLDDDYMDINGKIINAGSQITINPLSSLVLFPI